MSNRKLLVLTGVFLALLAFVVLFERKQPTSERAREGGEAARGLQGRGRRVGDARAARPPEGGARPEGEGPLDGRERAGLAGGRVRRGRTSSRTSARLDVVGETRTAFDPKEFGLDAPKAKATVAFADKSSKIFSFGAPIPGTDAVAAAAGPVFGAVKFAPLANLTKPVDEYRSKQLFDVPVADITRMSVTRGPNTVVVARGPKGAGAATAWRLEKPVADLASDSFVDRLLGDLAGVRVVEFPGARERRISPASVSRRP